LRPRAVEVQLAGCQASLRAVLCDVLKQAVMRTAELQQSTRFAACLCVCPLNVKHTDQCDVLFTQGGATGDTEQTACHISRYGSSTGWRLLTFRRPASFCLALPATQPTMAFRKCVLLGYTVPARYP